VIFSLLADIDISYKSVEHLYSNAEVLIALLNILQLKFLLDPCNPPYRLLRNQLELEQILRPYRVLRTQPALSPSVLRPHRPLWGQPE